MNHKDAWRIIREARDRGEAVDLHGADLYEVDLSGANLTRTDLHGADLHEADLSGANLTRTDLHGADLGWADLTRANLTGADLTRTNLIRADLRKVTWDGFCVDGIYPYYRCLLVPTPDGWTVTIGCWSGSVAELRDLISRDDGWPEARGKQVAERRPLLEAFCGLCDAHIAAHWGVIDDLAARWSR